MLYFCVCLFLLLNSLNVRRFPPPSSRSMNCVTLVPKPGRKEVHAVREPSLLRGIAVLRRSGSMKEEAGTGEHLKNLIIKINKHKSKAAAPHGRLPHTEHKLKSRPGPLSSCTVVTPPFILPELLRGDSRPVSGAGVAHHH